MDRMGNAQMGAMTDETHDVWTCSMDDAWMRAMTVIPYDGSMDGTDNACTGAMTDHTMYG